MRSLLPFALLVPIVAILGLGVAILARTPQALELLGKLGVGALSRAIDEPEPVTVIVVGSDESIATVRDSVLPEEILYTGPGVLAVQGGRIVVARVESASEALNELGWIDRPLEILGTDSWRLWPQTRRRLDPRTHPNDGGPSLAEMAGRPTLTAGEAIRALRMLRTLR